MSSLLSGLRQRRQNTAFQSTDDSITVVICSASLAGGWSEDNALSDSVEISSDIDVDKFVVDQLLATAQAIVDCGANVLACQKVRTQFQSPVSNIALFCYSNNVYFGLTQAPRALG